MMQYIHRLGTTPRFSEAVIANGFVFLSGMVPENIDADIRAQTANVLAQIDDWLAQVQSDKSLIIEATIFLANMDNYEQMNEVWDSWVIPNHAPARACVEAKLANSEWKVEIKISALQKA